MMLFIEIETLELPCGHIEIMLFKEIKNRIIYRDRKIRSKRRPY